MLHTTKRVAGRYADVIAIELFTRMNPHIDREHVPAAWVKAQHRWLADLIREAYEHMETMETK